MNETNKFKDYSGDAIQASYDGEGLVEIYAPRGALLEPDQAIEFAKQLTELAKEAKAKQ